MSSIKLPLQALVNFLDKEKIKYAVLGGIAVLVYGEPRFTADIDVDIMFDKYLVEEFFKKARQYQFKPATSKAKKIAKTTGVIPMNYVKGSTSAKFDFIIAENILEYTAIERGATVKIGGVRIKVVTPEDLIIHKITSSRARDNEDIKGILMHQGKKLDLAYIQNWLKKIDKVNAGQSLFKKFKTMLKDS